MPWFREEDIKAELARNQEPVERLYRTLETYFFAGYPQPPAFYKESVPAEQQCWLSHLISLTERWIIAHEYGHGFAAELGFAARARESESVERAEEYFADDEATMLTVMSAAKLDALRPDVSLAGAAFVFACLEVIRRGLSVVRTGRELPDTGDEAHPPNEMRLHNVLAAFDYYFEVGPQNGGIDLTLVHRRPDWTPVDSEARRQLHARAYAWSNALFTIWDGVRPRLLSDREKKSLHPLWK